MVPSENLQDGTIEFVTRRLERWGHNAPRGLALVTFDSEFARQQVVEQLKGVFSQAGILFHELALPVRQPVVQVIHELVKQLAALEPGIVSISGFATASEPEKPLGEVVRIFNFNRENLAQSHLRSIWWVTREFSTRLLVDAPDLHSWFLVRLELTEQVVELTENKSLFLSGEHSAVSVELARKQSAYLAERFEIAFTKHASIVDLTWLAVESVSALLDAGFEQEAQELSRNFLKKLDYRLQISWGHPHIENAWQYIAALTHIAKLYKYGGWHSNAELRFQQALEECEHRLGPESSEIIDILNHLATLYLDQKKYRTAEPLLNRALKISEHQRGPDHPDTAIILNNLGFLYDGQKNYPEAKRLYQQSLAIREQQLGLNHPMTAQSLNNLATLVHSQGNDVEAEPLFRRALEIRKSQFGDNHPDTANSFNNLAALLDTQGKYEEAEPLYKQSYRILRSKLGKDHPDTKLVKRNYLLLLRQMGRPEELD